VATIIPSKSDILRPRLIIAFLTRAGIISDGGVCFSLKVRLALPGEMM
jgi:hypothetical protein